MRYLWTVRYRRGSWDYRRSRSFRSEPPARRLIGRLLAGAPGLAPIVDLTLEREPLGEPETVWTFDFEEWP